MSYNGWTNWETWNVHMWIGNDEMFHRMMTQGAKNDWEQFKALAMQFGITKTPDDVSFEDPKVNQDEIREAYAEEKEEVTAELFPGTRDALNSLTIRQEDNEEEEEECSVLEGRRLLKTRSFYI